MNGLARGLFWPAGDRLDFLALLLADPNSEVLGETRRGRIGEERDSVWTSGTRRQAGELAEVFMSLIRRALSFLCGGVVSGLDSGGRIFSLSMTGKENSKMECGA